MLILKNLRKAIKCSVIGTRLKHSYAFEPSNHVFSPLTIGQLLTDCANDSPNNTACIVVHQNIKKSYRELNFDVNKLASGLRNIGCKKGDRVGIWAPNCYEWLLSQYATAKIGAIMVNVNPGYRAQELEYCLNLVECHTLISFQKFKSSNYCDILESISPNILRDARGTQVNCDKIPSLKNLVFINAENDEEIAPNNVTRFNDLYLKNENHIGSDVESESHFDDSINIQFTSGTTGRPKGATLTHHNIIQNSLFIGKRIFEGLSDSQLVVCVPVPLYHCFGTVVGAMTIAHKRGTLVLPAPFFSATDTLKAIEDFKCSFVYGTPTMYVDMLSSNAESFDSKSLIRAIMSGAPCPPPLIERVKNEMPTCEHVLIPYGSTESSPVVTLTSIKDSKKHSHQTVGRPLDHIEIKVIDPQTGKLKPYGEPGEVCSRGHCTFAGYWNQYEKTREVLDQNRWYHTGDIGSIDENGYLSISGRIKDMIIRGGENIYPKEIEDFLIAHPSVADAHVVGIPDQRMGEELVAYVKVKNGVSLNEKLIKEYCKGKISHFKIPRFIEFVDEFPRTVTGKVQKFKLKETAKNTYSA